MAILNLRDLEHLPELPAQAGSGLPFGQRRQQELQAPQDGEALQVPGGQARVRAQVQQGQAAERPAAVPGQAGRADQVPGTR